MSNVVWVIFVVVVDFVLLLYDPIGVNTSTCLSVVSVTVLAKLDKGCGHEDKWQDLLISGTSSVNLVNAQVHRQGLCTGSNREWQHQHIFHANHYIYFIIIIILRPRPRCCTQFPSRWRFAVLRSSYCKPVSLHSVS